MSTQQADAEHEVVERFSRRSLWLALTIMLLLGGFAFATLVESGAAEWAGILLPLAIFAAIIALGKAPGSPRAQQAVQQDELHRQSVALAQRDALIAVLVAQPLFAAVTTQVSLPSATALMACATLTLGSVVLLASILLRDR